MFFYVGSISQQFLVILCCSELCKPSDFEKRDESEFRLLQGRRLKCSGWQYETSDTEHFRCNVDDINAKIINKIHA